MATNPIPMTSSLVSAEQEQIRSLLQLNDAIQKINSEFDFDSVVQRISDEVANLLGCVETSVWVRDADNNEMVLASVRGCSVNKPGVRMRIGEQGMVGHVAFTGRTRYAPDVRHDPFYVPCEEATMSEIDIPLIHNGEVVGVFTAECSELDGFCPEKRELLERLAGHMANAVQKAKGYTKNRDEREEARRIQMSLFPKSSPLAEKFRIGGLCVPAGEVGGDWYDYFALPDGRIAVVLADVSGKGLPAALLMSSTRGIVRAFAPFIEKPGDALIRLNQMLVEDLPPEKFVTMVYGILDPKARTFTYSNAGHPWPVYRNGQASFLQDASGLPLGVAEFQFSNHTVELAPGSRLVLYSDGIAETEDRRGEEYGTRRLLEAAVDRNLTAESLLADVAAFGGSGTFADDATIVVIQAE